ncbi:hypothetical protein SCHIN_v1c03230 [Spiroplasma chinense]|uniref:Uncharacterized protein n=1 Tax=Spiroplasma chinense TaxID=216932 RepID=A0A5B9Y379_9MOLU|nr:hypothetical protein [Spiroplasma chinense]QEH61520.1 hypothetical protein SCHIN_v1c03230 [Spiroplasma chinense]
MHKDHFKYPFCCKEDSEFFSTLLENYMQLRKSYDGLKILNSDYQIYGVLANSNLEVLLTRLEKKIDDLSADILEEAENKFWSIASLLFIYYVKLVFEKIDSNFKSEEFIKFIKDESVDVNNSFSTEEGEQALKFIKVLLDDIEGYKTSQLF